MLNTAFFLFFVAVIVSSLALSAIPARARSSRPDCGGGIPWTRKLHCADWPNCACGREAELATAAKTVSNRSDDRAA